MVMPTPPELLGDIDLLMQTAGDDDAYTLTFLVDFSISEEARLIDAKYIAATQRAKELLDRPLGDQGHEWQSLTLEEPIYRQSAKVGKARLNRRGIEPSYVVPVIKGDGTVINLIKTARAIPRGPYTLYWTKLEVPDGQTTAPHINEIPVQNCDSWDRNHIFFADIKGAIDLKLFELVNEIHKLSGASHEAASQLLDSGVRVIKNRLTTLRIDDSFMIVNQFDAEPTERQSDFMTPDDSVAIVLRPAMWGKAAGWQQKTHYIHNCRVCGGSWLSGLENPSNCGIPKCRSLRWRGTTAWERKRLSREEPDGNQ